MAKTKGVSRRDFLKGAAVAGVGAAAVGLAGCQTGDSGGSGSSGGDDIITVPPVPQWDYEADVVVAGFGFAGQGAAIEANDLGASVIVLEKAPREFCGGSSAANVNWASGMLGNSAEADYNYHVSLCWGTVDDLESLRMHCDENQKLPEWFEKIGGEVVQYHDDLCFYKSIPGADEWYKDQTPLNGLQVLAPQDYQDRFPFPDSKRSPYQEWMCDLMEEREIPLMCNTAAVQLVQNPVTGEVLGVKALTDVNFSPTFDMEGGTEIYVKANKGVVLATGGYERNQEMLKNYSRHAIGSYVTQYGSPYQDGEGVTMAQKVGAKLWHMNKRECHMFATTAGSKEYGLGIAVYAWAENIGSHPGIIVNRDGKRFYNEYHHADHSEQTRAYDAFEHKQENPDGYEYADYRNQPFFYIFDDTTMKDKKLGYAKRYNEVFGVYLWSDDNQAELEKGWIIQGDTLEDLAGKIATQDTLGNPAGMDAAGLVETVAKYNEYCASGVDADFGRAAVSMQPLVTPPFYAMEVCECQTNTDGGPKRNGYCQVLDAYEEIIPRLYCAGELGSIYGFLYNGQQNIPEAQTSGIRAGRHAAGLDTWDAASA